MFEGFIIKSEYVDFDSSIIIEKAKELFPSGMSDLEKVKTAYEFVRDEIPHSFDCKAKIITTKASDVLSYGTGICHAKANLLAALLRHEGIPAGFCYQHLTLADDESLGYCIHAFNAVYIDGHWIKLDARGNTNGRNAQFSIGEPVLAFANRPQYDEYYYKGIYAKPHQASMDMLESAKSIQDVIDNIPDYLYELPDIADGKLKTGIIGGIGPASTLDYYNDIINGYLKLKNDGQYPELVIESVNMTDMINYLDHKEYDNLVEYIREHLMNLKAAGADFALLASNTPHIVFDQLKKVTPLPLISIVEETCKYSAKMGYKKILVLGTKFTMQSGLYENCFRQFNIEVMTLDENMIEAVHNIIFPNLENGIVIPEEKQKLIAQTDLLCKDNNIDAVVLGCTELPLMIKEGDLIKPVINTVDMHVNAVLDVITNR